MRRGRGPFAGQCAVIVGVIILLGLLLPQWLWWVVCAAVLIWGGIWLMRC